MTTFAKIARKIINGVAFNRKETLRELFVAKGGNWTSLANNDNALKDRSKDLKKWMNDFESLAEDESLTPTLEENKHLKEMLGQNKISTRGFDYDVYRRLLPIVQFAHSLEGRGAENPPPTPELHAAKLTILFGSVKGAIRYLRQYEKSHPKCEDLLHDACAFSLPKSPKWNVAMWRKIAKNRMPNPELRRILPFMDKIEAYTKAPNHKEDIKTKVTRALELEISLEYDRKQMRAKKVKKETLEEYLTDKLGKANLQKKIRVAAEKEFNEWQKMTSEATKGTMVTESDPFVKTLEDFIKKVTIEVAQQLTEQYQKKQEKVGVVNENQLKQAYIEKELKARTVIIQSESRKLFEENFVLTAETPTAVLTKHAHQVAFDRTKERPTVAMDFLDHDLGEKEFNLYLGLKPSNNSAEIPDITIEGASIDPSYQNYYLKKLDPRDPKLAYLGTITSCCQSLGKPGEEPVIHSITSPHGGIYVLCQKQGKENSENDEILAQCWAWRSKEGHMVLDSVESQVNVRQKHQDMTADFFAALAQKLVFDVKSAPPIERVLVGAGGLTPARLKLFKAISPGTPIDHKGYQDSTAQCILADKKLNVSVFLFPNAAVGKEIVEKTKVEKEPTEKEKMEILFLFCDLCVYNKRLDLLEQADMVVNLVVDNPLKQKMDARVKQTQQWLAALEAHKVGNKASGLKTALELAKLIEAGVNLDFAHPIEETLLFPAILQGHFELVKQLVKREVNIHGLIRQAGTGYNLTTLQTAIDEGHLDIANFLMNNGADIHTKGSCQRTALFFAAASKHPEAADLVDALIKAGADRNAADEFGITPIMMATRRHNTESVKLLLNAGVQDLPNPDGETAFKTAVEQGFTDIVDLFNKVSVKETTDLKKNIESTSTAAASTASSLAAVSSNGASKNMHFKYQSASHSDKTKASNLSGNRSHELRTMKTQDDKLVHGLPGIQELPDIVADLKDWQHYIEKYSTRLSSEQLSALSRFAERTKSDYPGMKQIWTQIQQLSDFLDNEASRKKPKP